LLRNELEEVGMGCGFYGWSLYIWYFHYDELNVW
jgi:hypothetical protein